MIVIIQYALNKDEFYENRTESTDFNLRFEQSQQIGDVGEPNIQVVRTVI